MHSASEQHQYEIQTALAVIDGQENISEDIIVHGKDNIKEKQNGNEVNWWNTKEVKTWS